MPLNWKCHEHVDNLLMIDLSVLNSNDIVFHYVNFGRYLVSRAYHVMTQRKMGIVYYYFFSNSLGEEEYNA